MNHSIPATMHAVQLDEPNGPLTLREIPVPRPQAGQVLIRMAAAPINPSDLGSLSGVSYSGKRQFPFTPGLEGSGTVIEAGEGFMPRLLNGRRVACSALLTGDGTWAEYMVTSAQSCIPLEQAGEFGTRHDAVGQSVERARHLRNCATRQTSCHGQHRRSERVGGHDFAFGETTQRSRHSCGAASSAGGLGARARRRICFEQQ